jgi:surface protein
MSAYNKQLSGDGVVQTAKGRTLLGFAQTYNTQHPTAPYRFKSAADHLAFKRANILNLAGPIYSKMTIVIYTNTTAAVTLPFGFAQDQSVYVDWGDGSPIVKYTSAPTHQYATQATYTVTVTGTAASYGIGNVPDPGPPPEQGWYNTISIDAWLPTLTSLSGALAWQADNLASIPPTIPPTVTDLSYMFFRSSLTPNTSYAPVIEWDVSNVVDMNCMFFGAELFNLPLATWNVSRVTVMDNMFESSAINQDLSAWPVVSIQGAQNIFANPSALKGATFLMISEYYPNFPLYNPVLPAVPNVYYSGTNTPPAVGETLRVVIAVSSTDGTISLRITGTLNVDWGDGSPPDTLLTHDYTSAGTYTVTLTGDPLGMPTAFYGVQNASSNIVIIVSVDSWFNSITNLSGLFSSQPNNFTVPSYLPTSITILGEMFLDAVSFNQPLESWNTATVIDMSSMFGHAVSFNQPLSSWNTAAVTNMYGMFSDAASFNGDISRWNTGAVVDMEQMFRGAVSFNQPLNLWNTASVTTMELMFSGAVSFNQDLNNWDVTALTSANVIFANGSAMATRLANWPPFVSNTALPDPASNPAYYTG